ncbi:O-antigen ligase family protein [Leifsonia sp. 2MCAF36]|uniref:O-antigen ligase family protein n=1 Tax=Leifsonia sp. 2MCAF36 TaxID=3232988 RepID=UPI003F9E26B0
MTRAPELSEAAVPGISAGVSAAWMINVYVAALMLIPANLTVSALGSVGTPALLLGLCGLVVWLGGQMNRSRSTLSPSQPVRRATFLLMIAAFASYIAATAHPIGITELSAADRGILLIVSWVGIVLLASDGFSSLFKLETTLRFLVFTGGLVAVLGLVQFATGQALIDSIQIPGLSPHAMVLSVNDRSGFNRVAGTATHPIEFGVVLSMMLPLALHFAFADTHRGWFLRWFPVVAIAFAIPISVSRSAIVATAAALIILLPTWPVTRRRISYLAIVGLIGVVYVSVPGMLGAITKLFTGIGTDTSAASRTDSYALAWTYIERSPVLGRGLLTFLPEYRILDNQYLGLLIEVGIIGTAAFIGLVITGLVVAFTVRKSSADPAVRSIAISLVAFVVAGACGFATFDAFTFPQVSDLLFLALGLIGALSNIQRRSMMPTAAMLSDRGR